MRFLLTVFFITLVVCSNAQDCCSPVFGYKLFEIIFGGINYNDSAEGFVGQEHQVKNNLARVDSLDNVYIFTDCQPIIEYEKVGQIDIRGGKWNLDSYEEMKQDLVRDAKSQYNDFDAILFKPPGGSIFDDGNAVLIKFKF